MSHNMSGEHPMVGSPHFQEMVEKLGLLWQSQQDEVQNIGSSRDEFKSNNDLPLARIKRIMKSDEDVRMISAEAPLLFAKACELFILELTVRSWAFAEFSGRNGMEKEDVLNVLQATDIFDFLAEILVNRPKEAVQTSSTSAGAASNEDESKKPERAPEGQSET